MTELKELLQFLTTNQRHDLKTIALSNILSFTGSKNGKSLLLEADDIIHALFLLCNDNNAAITKDALLSLINLTADTRDSIKIFEISKNPSTHFPVVTKAVEHIIDKNAPQADLWCMLLSNLTRVESHVPEIMDLLEEDEKTLPSLLNAFNILNYNKTGANLHYLGPIFSNLTQTHHGREFFCKKNISLLEKLANFVKFEESVIRRGGVIGTLKNICFDPAYHNKIINDTDESFLPVLLYPLCGPEEFRDEENDKFPYELQYLPADKTRETDPDLRQMILECLLQLCATKFFRELLREKGTYEILREYHKWEANVGRNKNCILACENVVDILIKKETEIGLDNLKDVEVPESAATKFEKEDTDYLENLLE